MGGRPAYIAAAGYVFDVTAHPSWRAGSHHGILAGQDVTDRLLENHPEGLQMLLENLPVVGRLRPSQKKGF
jgi:predicted heme/steroid binding protein